MKETDSRFNRGRPPDRKQELYDMYGRLDEDAAYQQLYHLRSIKNPTQLTIEKIEFVKRRIANLQSRKSYEEE